MKASGKIRFIIFMLTVLCALILAAGAESSSSENYNEKDSWKRLDQVAEDPDAAYAAAEEEEAEGNLLEAYRQFTALIPYRDSREQADRVLDSIHLKNYETAQIMVEEGKLEDAYEIFQSLIPYRDSMDKAESVMTMIQDREYKEAEALEKEGKLEEAFTLYNGLGDYKDSREKAYVLEVTRFADSVRKLSDDLMAYRFHGLWGFINLRKNTASSARWETVGDIDQNTVTVSEKGLCGLVNEDGEELIPPSFSRIEAFDGYGLAKVQKDDLVGLIDNKGTVLCEPIYLEIGTFGEDGYAGVRKDSGWGYINTQGKEIITCRWMGLSEIRNGICMVYTVSDENLGYRLGIVNTENTVLIAPEWLTLDGIGEDNINSNSLHAPDFSVGPIRGKRQDGLFALINHDGSIPANRFWNVLGEFTEKAAPVLEKNLWGFIREDGTVLCEPEYEQVAAFSEGMAAVKKNGKWGYINEKGILVIDTMYDQAESFSDGWADVYLESLGWNMVDPFGKRRYVDDPQFFEAEDMMIQGEWLEAAVKFEQIPKDPVAVYQGRKARYNLAEKQAEAGNYEGAVENYKLAGDYEDAVDKFTDVFYRWAEQLLGDGQRARAADMFHEILDYKDAAERELDIHYEDACAAKDAGNLVDAIAGFERCEGFRDSGEKKDETLKEMGRKQTEEGHYEEAITILLRISDEDMAVDEIRTVNDRHILALAASGDYDEAIRMAKTSEIHGDRSAQVTALKYQKAVKTMEKQDFEGAAAIFAELRTYRDSGNLYISCMQMNADKLAEKGKYEQALALYQTYGDAQTLMSRINEFAGLKDALAAWQHSLKAGDKVQFGQDENEMPISWVILERSGNTLLIISEKAIGKHTYVMDRHPRTWDRCMLRNWLNEEFLSVTFTAEEQKNIQSTKVLAKKTRDSRLIAGKNTMDYVYLLNESEIIQYGSILKENGLEEMWWTRSPGRESSTVLACKTDVASLVSIEPWKALEVRPVMNVKESAFLMP